MPESDFPAPSILQVPACLYLSVAPAQPALKYLHRALAGFSWGSEAPTAGSEKHSPAQGRWANAQHFLRRDSSRRCRTRCRAKDELGVYRVQELYSHWWIHCSTWGEEWAPVLPNAPIPLHNLCWPSLGVIQPSPLKLGAAGEPKLTLTLWLLPAFSCWVLSQS